MHVCGNYSEITGKVRIGWNERFLLIGAELKDKTHHQLFPLWMGDSIQFGVAPAAVDPQTTVEFSAAWRMKYDDSMVFAEVVPPGFDGSAIRRTSSTKFRGVGDKTIYEMAIPWTALHFVRGQKNTLFHLAFAVNDNVGGKTRHSAICYGDGIVCTKTSAFYPIWFFDGEF